MTEAPRVELPSLQAQSDQVVRMGAARIAARDTVDRADQDYELELHSQKRTEEVNEAERVATPDGHRQRPDDERPGHRRHAPEDESDDEPPHVVDLIA